MDVGLLHFSVAGQFGPMTLTFKPMGKHPEAHPAVTDEMAARLTEEEVVQWYTRNGQYPKGGVLTTKYQRHYCGLFKMV